MRRVCHERASLTRHGIMSAQYLPRYCKHRLELVVGSTYEQAFPLKFPTTKFQPPPPPAPNIWPRANHQDGRAFHDPPTSSEMWQPPASGILVGIPHDGGHVLHGDVALGGGGGGGGESVAHGEWDGRECLRLAQRWVFSRRLGKPPLYHSGARCVSREATERCKDCNLGTVKRWKIIMVICSLEAVIRTVLV